MPRELILAIDQGTTGTTALLVNKDLKVCSKATADFEQVFPKPGWVEHRGDDIWTSIKTAVTSCLAKANKTSRDIAAIGLTNQRETTGLFGRDGSLVHNFIVWQCRRSASICDSLRAENESLIRQKTGLVLDPYFSATKLAWLFKEHPDLLARTRKGELLFGTIDTWMLLRLSGGKVHATDATNASRTLLFNLDTKSWDNDLLNLFQVPSTCLPQIHTSSEIYGATAGLDFLDDGIPIAGIAGDQQAALFGQACLHAGEAKVTFGTGAFVLMHTGERRINSQHGLLSSVALSLKGQFSYCLEGSAFAAGAAIQWLKDGLKMIDSADQIEALALEVADSGEAIFVPALAGLGAPHWRPEARALLCGVSRGTTRAHIARALLEGLALQNRDILEAMAKDGVALKKLKVDGGASQNNLLMQMQADFLNVSCLRPANVEATAFGAAYLAGLGAGIFSDPTALSSAWTAQRVFEPKLESGERDNRIAKWRNAVSKA